MSIARNVLQTLATSKDTLIRTHTKEKPYQYECCQKYFGDYSNRIGHLRLRAHEMWSFKGTEQLRVETWSLNFSIWFQCCGKSISLTLGLESYFCMTWLKFGALIDVDLSWTQDLTWDHCWLDFWLAQCYLTSRVMSKYSSQQQGIESERRTRVPIRGPDFHLSV